MGELRCRLILKSGGYGFPLIRAHRRAAASARRSFLHNIRHVAVYAYGDGAGGPFLRQRRTFLGGVCQHCKTVSLCRAALFCSWDMENNRVKRGGSLHSLLSCEEGRHSLKGFAAKKIWNEKMSKNTILHDMVIKIVSMLFSNKYK